jgi:type I site-specific restriction endonuclease
MSDDLTQNLPTSQDGTLAQILATVQNLSTRMESLEKKVEERLHDTRPIWEKVQADIVQLQEGQDALRKELNTHWRDMNRKLSIFNDNLVQMQADNRDIYDRVRGLEKQNS